jgi:PAS domain S-box-containing protein
MKKETKPSVTVVLRQKLEELLNNKPSKNVHQLPEQETLEILHELDVHQVELEMQNEELNRARSVAQTVAQKYAELYDFAPSSYFTLSKEGKIIELNLSSAEMLGKERSNLINNQLGFFISDETKPIFNFFLFKVFTSKTRQTCEVTLLTQGKSPKIDLMLTGIAFQEDAEQCLVSGVDITEHRRNEELLRENERFLKETQVISQLGTYTMDINSGSWVSSEVMDHIFGIDADFEKTFDGWVSILHPEWKKIMEDYFFQEVLGNKTSFDKEYKIIRLNDKAERWVHGSGRLKFDAKNQPVMMVGTIRDITEYKLAVEAINRSQLFLMSSLESLKNTVLLFGDQNYRYLYFNKAYSDVMKHAYNKEIKIGMNILECITSENDRKSFQENYDRALKGESQTNTRLSGDLESAYYENFFNPILNDKNEISGVTVLSINITERKRAEAELEKWANIFKPKSN